MPQNYFITGQPKAGKTTLLKELVAELKKSGLSVGGFVSPEERHHGTRMAFQVMDVESGKKGMLASVDGDGPKVSKYHVDVKSFEAIAVPSMEKRDSYDVFVIDEIGVMEMKSGKFEALLDEILESDTPLIATLNDRYVDEFRESGDILDLDKESRGQVFQRLLRLAKASITKRAPAAKEKPAPKKAPPKKAPAKAGKAARVAPPKAAKKAAPPPKAKKAAPAKMAPPPRMEEAAEKPEPAAHEAPPAEERPEPAAHPKQAEEKPSEEHKKKKKEGIFGRIKKLFGG